MDFTHTPVSRSSFRSPLRILVGIASYGLKNVGHLQAVIRSYREMPFDVRIVVLSEAPKQQSLDAEVRVGLPSRNPASLPFAHKSLFFEERDNYDLFIYTEDDIDVSVENVNSFLAASAALPTCCIAGFLRYEVAPDGHRTIPDAHGRFHWQPNSVQSHGAFVTAVFTNEHAGLYMLTRAQLQSALASGEYLRRPHAGRYGMLESAATDIYTVCGMRKVICVSHLDGFLVHHRPNRYVGVLGISLDRLHDQVGTLTRIARGQHPATTLLEVEPEILQTAFSKRYDEDDASLIALINPDARRVLSIGAGNGHLECRLADAGHDVTVLPLDSVVGSQLAGRGLRVVYGTLGNCMHGLSGERFDCVVASNILHLTAAPEAMLSALSALVAGGGSVVVRGPNPERLSVLVRRCTSAIVGVGAARGPWLSRAAVVCALERTGMRLDLREWGPGAGRSRVDDLASFSGRLSAGEWVLRAAAERGSGEGQLTGKSS